MSPPPCKSCQKTADTGKKQSTTKKICSSIIGILTNEIGKTKNKTKLDILKGGLGYANDVCGSGGAPDLAKITKGLPEADKKRILQKTSSALFDGTADAPSKDFNINSKQAPTLTGAGGRVADLKNSEPDIKKVSPVTEFSLSGAKLSGETPGQAATKQSSVLLASVPPVKISILAAQASPVKASADTDAAVSSAKSPADTPASAKTAVSAAAKATKYTCSGPFNASGVFTINPCTFAGSFEGVLTLIIYADDTGDAETAGSWKSIPTAPWPPPPIPPSACGSDSDSFNDHFVVTVDKPSISFSGGEGIPHQTFSGTLGEDSASGTLTFTYPHPSIVGSASASVNLKCGCSADQTQTEKGCELTKCVHIKARIEEIDELIAKWKENPNYKPANDPEYKTWTDYAGTKCHFKGSEIEFYPEYYKLDPERKIAVVVHEQVHAQQCKKYQFLWWDYYKWDKELRKKGWPGPFEIPAHEAEKTNLETAAAKLKCK